MVSMRDKDLKSVVTMVVTHFGEDDSNFVFKLCHTVQNRFCMTCIFLNGETTRRDPL